MRKTLAGKQALIRLLDGPKSSRQLGGVHMHYWQANGYVVYEGRRGQHNAKWRLTPKGIQRASAESYALKLRNQHPDQEAIIKPLPDPAPTTTVNESPAQTATDSEHYWREKFVELAFKLAERI